MLSVLCTYAIFVLQGCADLCQENPMCCFLCIALWRELSHQVQSNNSQPITFIHSISCEPTHEIRTNEALNIKIQMLDVRLLMEVNVLKGCFTKLDCCLRMVAAYMLGLFDIFIEVI